MNLTTFSVSQISHSVASHGYYLCTLPQQNLSMGLYGNEFLVRSKTPAECLGEHVVRPLLDRAGRVLGTLSSLFHTITRPLQAVANCLPSFPSFPTAYAHQILHSYSQAYEEPSAECHELKFGEPTQEELGVCAHAFHIPSSDISQEKCFAAMYKAVQSGFWEPFAEIVDMSNKLTNSAGRSLLWEAVHLNDHILAELLIEHKIALQTRDAAANTPMHYAAKMGHLALTEELLRHNNILAVNHQNQTPLHVAAEYGRASIVALLMEKTAHIDRPSLFQKWGAKLTEVLPLHLAVINGHIDTVRVFMDKSSIDITLQVPEIGHILHLAMVFEQFPMFEFLLTEYHDRIHPLVNVGNRRKVTVAMQAAKCGAFREIIFLRKKGAYLEATDHQGRSAVHWAAIGRSKDSMTILNHYGCNLEAMDGERKTPDKYLGNSPQDVDFAHFLYNLMQSRKVSSASMLMSCHPESIAIKGGGPKGIAYVGALEVMEQKYVLDEVLRVAGTSAGAITSALLAFGYSSEEMRDKLSDDFTKFLDHPLTLDNIKMKFSEATLKDVVKGMQKIVKYVSDPKKAAVEDLKALVHNIWHTTGACQGEEFRKWIDNLIAAKVAKVIGGTKEKYAFFTFGELRKWINKGKPFRHLHVVTIDLSTVKLKTLSSEDPTWDDVPISDGIRASMSIPFLFQPHILHRMIRGKRTQWERKGVYIDGGLINNFPLEHFDREKFFPIGIVDRAQGEEVKVNKRTLGLSLYSPEEKLPTDPETIQTLGDVASAIGSLYLNTEQLLRAQVPNKYRILDISNNGVGLMDFNLDGERKSSLVASGRSEAAAFFATCPDVSVVRKLNASERGISKQVVKKWSGILQELNTANPEALEWAVLSSFIDPHEISIALMNDWFQLKERIKALDFQRDVNFVSPFNSKAVDSVHVTNRNNIWRMLVHSGLFDYNKNTESLMFDPFKQQIVQRVVIKDKAALETVKDWVIAFWEDIKPHAGTQAHAHWQRHCQRLARAQRKLDPYQVSCG